MIMHTQGRKPDSGPSRSPGCVYLVGAGPGDPGLMTVAGEELIRRADVIAHDRLSGQQILSSYRGAAELIYAGKVPTDGPERQREINNLLIDRARRGQLVVRLKGGDPFVFGRGFEEIVACREAGVDCYVVPGVSSAFAVPAAVGIPVTSRRLVRSLAVVTGSVAHDSEVPATDFRALAKMDAVIVMMGHSNLRGIASSLIAAGMDAETPAACIQSGCTHQQRVAVGVVRTIADTVAAGGIAPPAITVFGQIAAYATPAAPLFHPGEPRPVVGERSARLPLQGRRIVLTRPRDRATDLAEALQQLGAAICSLPLIDIKLRAPTDRMVEIAQHVGEYDWIAFSSVPAVQGFWRLLLESGQDARALASCRFASIGPGTSAALRERGIVADIEPVTHGAAALAEGIVAHITSGGGAGTEPGVLPLDGSRILFPCSSQALPTFPDATRAQGALVENLVLYDPVSVEPAPEGLEFMQEGLDAILLCSPSAAKRCVELQLPVGSAAVACIGPTTAAAARNAGLAPHVVADRATTPGMVEALLSVLGEKVPE